MLKPLPPDDLAAIVQRVGPLWERLRGKRLFVTGGTGFIGRWMVESLARACADLNVLVSIGLLSRSQIGEYFVAGDVRTFDFPKWNPDFILHLAAPTDRHDRNAPSVIRDGTRRVCDFARACGAKLLHASSGCVSDPKQRKNYGAFAEAKADAEEMVREVGGVNRRIYTVFGPGMKFERYAIGQMLLDVQAGRSIQVTNPKCVRGFCYASDAAEQLWRSLLDESDRYGVAVGSSVGFTMRDAAEQVAGVTGATIAPMPEGQLECYVPEAWEIDDVPGAEVGLRGAIEKTWQWMQP